MAAEKAELSAKVMLVEPLSTMRYVLQKYCKNSHYETVSYDNYGRAFEALENKSQEFEYRCVILGWPNEPAVGADEFFDLLETPERKDLPVIVITQDLRADARAWVARRSHTLVLDWTDYRKIDGLVTGLLAQGVVTDTESFPAKFSNDDISILLVDDSFSIRNALGELLKLQGYTVDAVDTVEKAMELARAGSYDIALIDYYLQDSSGDKLCRLLIDDPQTSAIACAILTGTYSEKIVKQCLRAGAVDCMFKNESSELLLARIDAISRTVRNKRKLKEEALRLDAILGSTMEGVYGVDRGGNITFINSRAKRLLGYADDEDFTGKSAHELFHHSDENGVPVAAKNSLVQRAREQGVAVRDTQGIFIDSRGSAVAVTYTVRPLVLKGKDSGAIVEFSKREPAVERKAVAATAVGDEIAPGLLLLRHFESSLENEIERVKRTQVTRNLLLIGIEFSGYGGKAVNISSSAALVRTVSRLLVLKFPGIEMMSYFGDGQFGLILPQTTDRAAYQGARKVIQAIVSLTSNSKKSRIDCSGGLIGIGRGDGLNPNELISRTKIGCKIAKRMGRNYVFICDLKQVIRGFGKPEEKPMATTTNLPQSKTAR